MKLALLSGDPIRKHLFPFHNTIGNAEKAAVQRVFDSGTLSSFLGTWHTDFYGGPEVLAFEKKWADMIGATDAVSVNSNTSGLPAAVGACGVGPGDEVIVSPYTMSASAIAPIIFGGVPVFADIDPETFCLDPRSIEQRITTRTKAILVVYIFGHPADMDPILAIARRRGIRVIEDCAQAPYSKYKGRFVGTLGDLGVFSFNLSQAYLYRRRRHGDDERSGLAERVRLIRNHAEAVVGPKGTENLQNMLGYNFRMTEIDAAIGSAQMDRLPESFRAEHAKYLNEHFAKLPGLTPPEVKYESQHAYYLHVLIFDRERAGIRRDTFVKAIQAELPSARHRETAPIIGCGYAKPLYLQPLYQKRAAACSFNCAKYEGNGQLRSRPLPGDRADVFRRSDPNENVKESLTDADRADVVRAFDKVFSHVKDLQAYEREEKQAHA